MFKDRNTTSVPHALLSIGTHESHRAAAGHHVGWRGTSGRMHWKRDLGGERIVGQQLLHVCLYLLGHVTLRAHEWR